MTSTSPRVLFVCDSGPEIGGGHVMRSLTLARALMARGAACAFLAPPHAQQILAAFAPAAVEVLPLAEAELIATAARTPADAMVFDHFRIRAEDHRRAAAGRPSLAVDDLADRPLHADIVVDLGPDRRPEDYAGLALPNARLLLGPSYALVRPEFAERRPDALARRRGPVRQILVSLGLTDVGGITARVVEALLALPTEARITAVLGRATSSLARLQALNDPRLELVVEARDMDRLMAEADLAVGAGGSTTWERCTLALPTLLLILAPNQAPSALALERLGAAVVLDVSAARFEAAFQAAATRLLADEPARVALARAAGALCDGKGAERVADVFLARINGSAS